MARTPPPPSLGGGQYFLQRLIYLVLGVPLGLWMYWQLIWMWFVFFGWALDQLIGQGTSNFLFDGYREWWDTYKFGIMPEWFFYIPTWHDWYAWPLMALLAYLRFGGTLPRFGMPRRRRFTSPPPRENRNNRPNPNRSGAQRSSRSADDGFAFDPNAFTHGDGRSERQSGAKNTASRSKAGTGSIVFLALTFERRCLQRGLISREVIDEERGGQDPDEAFYEKKLREWENDPTPLRFSDADYDRLGGEKIRQIITEERKQAKTSSSPRGVDQRNPADAKLWAIVDDPAASDQERKTALEKILNRKQNNVTKTPPPQPASATPVLSGSKSSSSESYEEALARADREEAEHEEKLKIYSGPRILICRKCEERFPASRLTQWRNRDGMTSCPSCRAVADIYVWKRGKYHHYG